MVQKALRGFSVIFYVAEAFIDESSNGSRGALSAGSDRKTTKRGLSRRWKESRESFAMTVFSSSLARREIGDSRNTTRKLGNAEFRRRILPLMQIDRSRSSPAAFPLDFSFYF